MCLNIVLMLYIRYSYFHKLLPLLMTGLSDELPDIQSLAKELMSKVHISYSIVKKS